MHVQYNIYKLVLFTFMTSRLLHVNNDLIINYSRVISITNETSVKKKCILRI